MRRSLVLALLCACFSPQVIPQTQQPDPMAPIGPSVDRRGGRDADPTARRMEDERYRQLNKERQQKLKEDTEKLLKLANELKESVDKTNENVLSLEVVRKAEEIEKLAKSVKERMKVEQTPPQTWPPQPR